MAKTKLPFKKHPLPRPPKPDPYTPPVDKVEGLTASQKGYWPGHAYTALEMAFLKEIEIWQKRHRSKFLGHTAYLRILLSMGFSPPPRLREKPPTREDDE